MKDIPNTGFPPRNYLAHHFTFREGKTFRMGEHYGA
jgi:hypothetical protein